MKIVLDKIDYLFIGLIIGWHSLFLLLNPHLIETYGTAGVMGQATGYSLPMFFVWWIVKKIKKSKDKNGFCK